MVQKVVSKLTEGIFQVNICKYLTNWVDVWRSSPQLVKYLQIFTWNMPSVSLDTTFCTISLEKFEESVNRRRIDNTIKEQTMIYKTLHWKLKIEHHEPSKTVGLRCSRKVNSHNICTLSVNKTFIWNRCETGKKTRRTSFFFLFLKLVEINYIFVDNVCILSIYITTKSQYLTGSNAVGTAYFSGASESFGFYWGSCCSIFSFLCSVL
jgi:hypothetical protein